MSLLDKAKAAANQAAAKAKETAGEVQQKVELDRAYTALGKAAYAELEAGAISSETLAVLATKVRGLVAEEATDETPATDEAPTPPPAD